MSLLRQAGFALPARAIGDLHVGDPGTAVDFDGSPEGHHIRHRPDGAIVGLTILNAKLLLGKDGEIVVTLPEQTIRMSDLGDVLAAA